ncbi:expressed unknown protein [Seminavis robusta]|uniref:Uncharacterized protein n=1 Tax=Seminavis robusta TaxID=568900 RepID=A0A9N8DUD0_9STRA|nr:expressed unknown protein [Seminavis robusta]|eukprot:Sro364_g127010.1 n/a (542) ;mRNA; f:9772-11397
MTNNSYNSRNVSLDLSHPDSLRAMAVLCTNKARKQKIKTITLHVSSSSQQSLTADWNCNNCEDDHITMDAQSMLAVFTMLGSFPQLRQVTVDLDLGTLPVGSLSVLLEGAQGLQILELRRVSIPTVVGRDLHKILRRATSLDTLTLRQCQGYSAVQAFLTHLPNLKHLELIGTKLSPQGTLTAGLLLRTCQNLQRLRLEDVPDLRDEHIQTLAASLAVDGDSSATLREFHLSSVSLGDVAGQAMAMLLQTTRFLQKVTLELGYWSQSGVSMAQILQQSTNLQHIQLLLPGRNQASVEHKARGVLAALATHPGVTHLKLTLHHTSCSQNVVAIEEDDRNNVMDSSSSSSCHGVSDSVWEALEEMLAHNHTLGSVIVMDTCFQVMELPPAIQATLDRNRAGLSRLLFGDDYYGQDNDVDEGRFHADYANAVINHKDNLDLVYFALSNHPTILSLCTGTADQQHDDMEASSPEQQAQDKTTRRNAPLSPPFFLPHKSKPPSPGSSISPNKLLRQGVRRLARGRWPRSKTTGSSRRTPTNTIRSL